jgi:hypothetical protein
MICTSDDHLVGLAISNSRQFDVFLGHGAKLWPIRWPIAFAETGVGRAFVDQELCRDHPGSKGLYEAFMSGGDGGHLGGNAGSITRHELPNELTHMN